MYSFPLPAGPAFRSQVVVQIAFFNGLSQAMSRTFQLNQALFDEAVHVGQRLWKAGFPAEATPAPPSRALPAAALGPHAQGASRASGGRVAGEVSADGTMQGNPARHSLNAYPNRAR